MSSNQQNIVIACNQATLNAISRAKTPPTIAARVLAIVHTSIFDAWAAYNKDAFGTRFADLLRRPAAEHIPININKAISFAAYRSLIDLYPAQTNEFTNLMKTLKYDFSDTSIDINTPSGIGNRTSQAVLNFRHNDGSNQLGDQLGSNGIPYSDYTGFIPFGDDPNHWQPLKTNNIPQNFLTPHWGLVYPFSLISGGQLRPHHLITHPNKKFLEQAEDVLKLSAQLDDKTKSIAEYWADGPGSVTPPGHWNLIGQFVSQRDEHQLSDDVKMFFILNNALFDASIAVWDCKRKFDTPRPISAIQFLFKNQTIQAWAGPGLGTKGILGQNWKSYIPTPPFPEYVSGHSTFSRAAAEVLKSFTGSDRFGDNVTIAKGSSIIEPQITPSMNIQLTWKTFTHAAVQAGLSRRIGGIHFESGDLHGQTLGRKIAKKVIERASFFIKGPR